MFRGAKSSILTPKRETMKMAMSINTNEGAFMALQTLNKTNNDLRTVQLRINTGMKVASAKDNGAVFAIAQNLRSDVAGLGAAKDSLDRATSALDVAIAAGDAIGDILLEMKEKSTAAADASLDSVSRKALLDDYTALNAQIGTIVGNAEFNGTNLIDSGGTDKVTAIVDTQGASSISVAHSDLSSASGLTVTQTFAINDAGVAAKAAALAIDAAIITLSSKMATFGASSKRFAISKEFVTKLSDSIEVGIGNLVDADMAKESANLQAMQVKQQLGLQALSIANQSPGAVMTLFR